MNLSRSQLLIYSLLGIIVMLTGMLIRQWQSYDARLAWWKMYGRGCNEVAREQGKVIREMLR